MLEIRDSIWDQPPPERMGRVQRNPTLLYTWWCTCFAAVIIIVRLIGRKVRSNVLFREDWVMMASMIPLFIRLGLIHVVLVYGTNNVQTVGQTFTAKEIHRRECGSQLVLAARIFYAAFIWTSKLTVSEFLKRITIRIWKTQYERTLHFIRIFLGVTFVAVVIATLAECHPFSHYWQVIPDPGPRCRTGYANLLTMGIADIITDVLLVVFPIPLVLRTGRTWKRKIATILLFSTSLVLIIVTAFRMPKVMTHYGKQQYRTVWASSEILASAFVSNFVIIGSFLRDKGTKRHRFKSYSATDSIDKASARRPTLPTIHKTSSDESLFRSFNGRMPTHLLETGETLPKPAPAALPATMTSPFSEDHPGTETVEAPEDQWSERVDDPDLEAIPLPSSAQRSVGFFDVGGLLDSSPSLYQSRATTIASSTHSGSQAYDFASANPSRRGSKARIPDLSAQLSLIKDRLENGSDEPGVDTTLSQSPTTGRRPSLAYHGTLDPMFEQLESEQSQEAPPLVRQRSFTDPPRVDFDTSIPEIQRRWAQPLLPRASTTSTLESRPTLSRPPTQQSLQDIGGLMSPDRQPDVSASFLQRFRTAPPSASTVNTKNETRNFLPPEEELEFEDPGGLLSKK